LNTTEARDWLIYWWQGDSETDRLRFSFDSVFIFLRILVAPKSSPIDETPAIAGYFRLRTTGYSGALRTLNHIANLMLRKFLNVV
jgi:hypothetical protein